MPVWQLFLIIRNLIVLSLCMVLVVGLLRMRNELAAERISNLLYDAGMRAERLKKTKIQPADRKIVEPIVVELPTTRKFKRFAPDNVFARHVQANEQTYKTIFSNLDVLRFVTSYVDPMEDAEDFLLARKVDRWISRRRYAKLRKALDREIAGFWIPVVAGSRKTLEFEQHVIWRNRINGKERECVYGRPEIEAILASSAKVTNPQ